MTIEKVFDSIKQIVNGIEEVYQCFLESFYDNSGYRVLWEEMLQGEDNQIDLLNRCISIMPSLPHPSYEIVGKDFNYNEILSTIEKYKKEIKDGLDINRALKIAFHLEVLEIQGIFNEIIKLPQEPYFDILSEMHLETRRSMGALITGIENYSYDEALLSKVIELKSCIIEKRSGIDRRAGRNSFGDTDRRNSDRRQDRIVKIVCKL
ncbi:MAG: hypothetical protein A2132_02310 [Nitrospirae bacterium RBG_16_43_11]|nr:MAG: hypothetical protein A2132_02310 [Nitrospirae bacterium RBG_16_43_11]